MRDFFGRPAAVNVIIRDKDKILMLKRIGPWKPGEYVPPSGHVEGKETLRAAAQRELKEEVGLYVDEKNLIFKLIAHRASSPEEADGREYLDFYFEATIWEGEPKNMEPEAHSEMIWISYKELDSYSVVDYTKKALKLIEQGETYGEFGWQ